MCLFQLKKGSNASLHHVHQAINLTILAIDILKLNKAINDFLINPHIILYYVSSLSIYECL